MKRWMKEDINTPEYFDHKWTHNTYQFDHSRLNNLLRYFKGGKVLDLGAGVKGLCHWLAIDPRRKEASKATDLVCVDYSKEAQRIVTEITPDVIYFVGDLRYTMFADSTFDMVASSEVIEHMEEPEQLVSEMWRVVKPDGVATISTVDPTGPVRRAGCVFPEHLWEFTPEDLKEMFGKYFNRVEYALLGDYHFIWAMEKK